jgi:predicted dehydrogenase
VLEQATHILDLMRYLLGECEVVAAQAANAPSHERGSADITDVSTVLLRFETGAIGTLATSRLLGGTHRVGLECFSTGQSLALDIAPHRLVVGHATETTHITGAHDLAATYRAQDRTFIDAIQGGPVALRSTWDDALRTHDLALRASELATAQLARAGLTTRPPDTIRS